MYRYEHSNIGMSVCIHDKGCTCHSVALSSSVCEGWPENLWYGIPPAQIPSQLLMKAMPPERLGVLQLLLKTRSLGNIPI